jgi:hypothetical protein
MVFSAYNESHYRNEVHKGSESIELHIFIIISMQYSQKDEIKIDQWTCTRLLGGSSQEEDVELL